MFGSTILDIAIGVVFIYLLLSLVVTAANELLAALAAARGRTLWRGICNLLPTGDGNATDVMAKKNFAQAVYDHPLVDGLSISSRPSYIPSRIFALALLDVIAEQDGAIELATLRTKIAALPESLRRPLNLLLHEAGDDLEHFKTNLEVWFNHAMDRVSGWYRRRVQYVLFAIAAFVTIVMNVDSVVLINRLSRDSTLRNALVAQAAAAKDRMNATPTSTDATAARDQLDANLAQLGTLDLPIGWSDPSERGDVFQSVRKHLLGWVLSAFAISLGAPFWFDVLNRFVNIRSTGKAPEEKPKKPKEVPHPQQPGAAP